VEHARQADATDLGFIADLWDEAIAELGGQRGGFLLAGSLTRADLASELKAAQADSDRLLVVGLLEEVSVGFASVFCDRQRREPIAAIELVYVQPDARQVGVAEAMIKEIMRWAGDRGCIGIDAPALPGSRSSKAFFEDNGFTARLLVMHHPIESGGPQDDA